MTGDEEAAGVELGLDLGCGCRIIPAGMGEEGWNLHSGGAGAKDAQNQASHSKSTGWMGLPSFIG